LNVLTDLLLDFWTPTDYSAPACVFTPKTQFQISAALLIFETFNAHFAVRGGGHMPIPGYANIDGGILVGMTDLNRITLSSDKSYVSVGPGRRWEEVYDFLEPYGLVVLGGRVGIVGVPGLLLGGGISFYSNQYGFASDNVIAFEVRIFPYHLVLMQSLTESSGCLGKWPGCRGNLNFIRGLVLGFEGWRKQFWNRYKI
jgi:FAD/FMN-containing dehydrogenase